MTFVKITFKMCKMKDFFKCGLSWIFWIILSTMLILDKSLVTKGRCGIVPDIEFSLTKSQL